MDPVLSEGPPRRPRRGPTRPQLIGAGIVAVVVIGALIALLTIRGPVQPESAGSFELSADGCVEGTNVAGSTDPWGGCWPGPQNTGYPQGLPGDTRTKVELTAYRGPTTISECGTVIDSKIVESDIVIVTGNGTNSPDTPCVTIKNSLVKGVIHTDEAAFGPVVVTDTEVAVPGLSWWENIGRYNVFVNRVNSHGSEGVVKCASYCSVTNTWVHGMRLGGEYHYNAIGGNGIEPEDGYFRIEHNWASCGDWASWDEQAGADAGCSAVIGFYGDFAPIRNITISKNYLAGMTGDQPIPSAETRQPGYCLNPGYYPGKPHPAPSKLVIKDNIFGRGSSGKCGVFGPTNSLNAVGQTGDNEWVNNTYEDGEMIGRPEQ